MFYRFVFILLLRDEFNHVTMLRNRQLGNMHKLLYAILCKYYLMCCFKLPPLLV